MKNVNNQNNVHRIVIVGGGAGGLSLVSRLGRHFRRNDAVEVMLVDVNSTHLWKPLLHEVATGSLDGNHDEISYVALARKHGFRFVLGEFKSIDTEAKSIAIEMDYGDADLAATQRSIDYDQIVLAIGSRSHDFGVPGVLQHAILLDDRSKAEQFHRRFLANLHRINDATVSDIGQLSVVIIGGGATGVELAADLHNVASQLEDFGFDRFNPEKLDVTLLEASPRVLGALPERISDSVTAALSELEVSVITGATVTEITADEVKTKDGQCYPANLTVWAAGVCAPASLDKSGLPVDSIGRVKTTPFLNIEEYPEVFVIGDCCHREMPAAAGTETAGTKPSTVPPRAQSAHQMAATVYNNIRKQYTNDSLQAFNYQDYGSLVNLSRYTTVGNLMKNALFIDGWIAKVAYRLLYRRHQVAVHGLFATGLIMIGDRIHRATHSHLKLH